MKWIKKIQLKIINYFIKEATVKRSKQFLSMHDVKSLQILYCINEELELNARNKYQELYTILDQCRERGIDSHLTLFIEKGYVEQKRHNITLFSKKDCQSITLRPQKLVIDGFLDHKADMILNLSREVAYPIEYLVAKSTAKFKVGACMEGQVAEYDFMLDMKEEQVNIKDLFKAVLFYLDTIQKNS